jgi:S-adenosyl-L-methionine hydrolase (adenosine-forming)
MPPVIALLTDFGTRDPYVGAMKGAILSVCPEATLVDVLHDVPPHDVRAGALALDVAYRYFPLGTVFVAVVDPGVGSDRRAIAAAAGRFFFVAPDNGLLTLVLESHPGARVHLLANPRMRREPASPVFHGRDLFGPAAAWIAGGLALEDAGPVIDDPVRLTLPGKARRGEGWEGSVLAVDRFGNLVTNLVEADLDAVAGRDRAGLEVRLGTTRLPLVRTYSDVPEGALCALVGSSGRVEIAANRRRACEVLGAGAGTVVAIDQSSSARRPGQTVLDSRTR